MSVFRTMFTGADNQSHDIGRYLAAAGVVVALFLETYTVVHSGKAFSIQEFGTGLALLFAGVGAMLKIKESTEPAQTDTPVVPVLSTQVHNPTMTPRRQ